MIGHGWRSPPERGTHLEPESDAAGNDPEPDTDERERGRGPGSVVEQEAEDRARDDSTGEEASEPNKVTSS
jgi:hypothetical protein